MAFRKKFCESLAELQQDLDEHPTFYNRDRAYKDYRTKSRTPYQALLDGVKETIQAEAA